MKDNIDALPFPTTAACETFRYTPERSAPVVQALEEAGAKLPATSLLLACRPPILEAPIVTGCQIAMDSEPRGPLLNYNWKVLKRVRTSILGMQLSVPSVEYSLQPGMCSLSGT